MVILDFLYLEKFFKTHIMRKLGSLMFFLGIFAIILNFVGRVPRLLMWIYTWGETVAWVIKIAFVVVGAVLYFMGSSGESEEVSSEG